MHAGDYSTEATEPRSPRMSVTILIPAVHVPLFRRRLNQSGLRPGNYFSSVVRNAVQSSISRKSLRAVRVRSLYQSRGLNLVRIHVRVDEATWFELSLLARSAGQSRCRYFWQLAFLDCMADEAAARLSNDSPWTQTPRSLTLTESVYCQTGRCGRRLLIRPPPLDASN